MAEQLFIRAKQIDGIYYHGQIYRYKQDGNIVKVLWTSNQERIQSEAGIDDAVEYAEENNIEIESIDFD